MNPENQFQIKLTKYKKALIAALGQRDAITRLHCERVEGIALALGVQCGLSAAELETIRFAAVFHDIGKIGIPDEVLLKPGLLSLTEWRVMQRHSEIGEAILMEVDPDGLSGVAQLVRHHHESYDGSGYPDRLAGEDVPIGARIIAMADSYDAMAFRRPYQAARPHREIMGIIDSGTGAQYDPYLVGLFAGVIEGSEFIAPTP